MCKCGGACGTNSFLGLDLNNVCLSKDCVERKNAQAEADAALKKAQAEAILKLNSGTASASGTSPIVWISIGVTLFVILMIVLLIVRKKGK